MGKNKIIDLYEKQLEIYEKMSFLEAKELISSIVDVEDESIKKNIILKVFKGTLYLVLNFIKNSRYEVINTYGYDLEDVINIAYESWYEKVASFEILRYEDAQRVFGITFANGLVEKLNPSIEELVTIYPCTKDVFISLLSSYINVRNRNTDLSYKEFVERFIEENKYSYYGLDCEYCVNMLERIYLDLSNGGKEEVKINKLSLQKISKLLILSSQIYPLSNNIESSVNFEDDVMTKLCYEQIYKLVFENPSLNEREKHVLALRFGFNDNKYHTLEEIGVMYGRSRDRIKQIEAKTLRKLRRKKDLYSLYEELYKNS